MQFNLLNNCNMHMFEAILAKTNALEVVPLLANGIGVTPSAFKHSTMLDVQTICHLIRERKQITRQVATFLFRES